MSVQYGRWNFEGQPPALDYIEKVSATLAPYGPDSDEAFSKGGVKILYRAFHTTKESHREIQPHISGSGAVIAWDGRLDNRAELISELRDSLSIASTDVTIVAATYEKWGTNCFAKLIGDWALSICNPNNRSLILARDPIGTRHLYYSVDNNQVTWSTILDPLVRFAGKTLAICEEYVAGWFALFFPAAHLTPYVGIHAVPPSCSVLIQPRKHGQHSVMHIITKYWDFDPSKKIRYCTDAEYEEHFRTVFAKAVQRKLRSDRPVLAELSGGMDSSSIVCMADTLIARGAAETSRLDTISWYDDSDPGLDERPYFTKVEEKRGRVGHHINVGELSQREERETGSQRSFACQFENDHFAATPTPNRDLSELFRQYAAYMKSRGHRVVLSGIGGDEATGGGVPTPTPELQNLLARARFFTLAHQLKAWATKMRKPRLPLLWDAIRGFFPVVPVRVPKDRCTTPWLSPGFIRRNRLALYGYPSRMKLFGPLPSFQDHIHKLEANRRFVSCCGFQLRLPRDIRYPYYDRDFLEFIYAIPREQIVRMGQRRSLMKRALVGNVPDELLNRKQKTFLPPEPKKNSSTEWPSVAEIGQHMVSSSVGIVDPILFWEALQKARRNEDVSIDSLKRTLTLEFWLRHLTVHIALTNSMFTERRSDCSAPEAKELSAPASAQKFS